MEILVALLIVLGVITLIGHGIWVLLAAIFRAFSDNVTNESTPPPIYEKTPAPPRQHSFCDHCGATLAANSQKCFSCGRPQLEITDKNRLSDLDATERQLQRFYEQGVLDDLKFNWLKQVVAQERQQLLHPVAAPPKPVLEPEAEPESGAPIRIESPTPYPVAEPQIVRAEVTVDEPVRPISLPAPDHRPPTTDHHPPPTTHHPPTVPPPPRKSLAEMLAAFMEEKNIRWGELLGGMLIIGCSLALVISLWAQIEQIPLLKFFIFTAMTGAFAGLGFYSEHRWKLPNTSRGLLITATMLVPLNFLAIAAFAKGIAANDPMVIASELISLALFVVIVYRAGKVVTPGWEHWLTLGAVGTSATQLILRRVAEPETSAMTLCLLAALPIAGYAMAVFGMLRKLREGETLEVKTANQSFTLLSASSFAAVVALGLLLFKTQALVVTLERIAPMISLLAIPALLVGIVLWRRVRTIEPAQLAVVSTSIAAFSALVMLASLVFAWPQPVNVMMVALINFAALTVVAFAFRLPLAHLAALPCLALASLLGVLLALGRAENDSQLLLTALLSATSGKALALLFPLILIACEVLYKRQRKDDGFYYALVTAGLGALSLLLVSLHGFGRAGDPQQIAWVYVLFATSAFYVAWRISQVWANYAGWGLAVLSLTQFLHFGLSHSFKLTTLLYATIALIAAIALRQTKELFTASSQRVAFIGSIVAGAVLLFTAPVNTASILAGQSLWLAALVAALAWLYRSASLFMAFQAITYASVFFAVTATTHGANLLAELPVGLRSLRAQMLALALLSPAWIALRLLLRKFGITREEAIAQDLPQAWQNTASRLLYPEWPTCDQVVTWVLIAGFVGLSLFFVLPGLLEEITPTMNAEIQEINLAPTTEWMLLGALLLVLTMSLWEQFTRWRVLGILLLLAMMCPLSAQSSVAVASTWRWMAAAYLLLTAGAIWFREQLYVWAQAMRFPLLQAESTQLASYARAFTLLLGATPIIGLTLWAADLHLGNGGLRVPSESLFARIGAVAAYLVPLIALSLVLVGHALRERATGYALASGVVLNFATTLAYLNGLSAMSAATWVRLVQVNAITSAVFALLWLGWQQTKRADAAPDWLLKLQVLIGATLNLIVIAIAGAELFVQPDFVSAGRLAVGSAWGWLALALAACGVAWLKRLQRLPLSLPNTGLGLLAVGVLVSCTLSRWDTGNWLGYHTMLVAGLIVTVVMLWAGFRNQLALQGESFVVPAAPRDAIMMTNVFGAMTLLMGARTLVNDPQKPWWAVVTFVALSLIATGLARLAMARIYLYFAGGLLNAAVSAFWSYKHEVSGPDFVAVNVIALALGGLALFVFERKMMREVKSNWPPFHHTAAMLTLLGTALPVAHGLLADVGSTPLFFNPWLGWSALLATVVLMIASLWDATATYAVGGLYLLGLVAAGLALDQANLAPRSLIFTATIIATLYVVLTSWLGAEKRWLQQKADALGIPPHEGSVHDWLVTANTALMIGVMVAGGLIVLNFAPLHQRLFAALAVVIQSLSLMLLAREESQRAWLRIATFGNGWVGAIWLGWAFLQPGDDWHLVMRLVIVLLVAIAFVEGLGLWFIKRLANDWGTAAKRLLRPLSVIAVLALSSIFAVEITEQFSTGKVAMPMFAILSVALVLLGLSMQAIYFAVRAERDPLQLSERGRMNYVYASEALLALSFLHVRLTMPWLFTGFFTRYWPFVVMALAFLGVGLGEMFRRRGQRVLGEPLLNTGFFLPIFPVIGFWLVASKVDYSGLLLGVGILYAVVAVLRSSFGVSLLACLAANGSLWYFLSRMEHFSLLERPQLWLTPAALSVLIAAYLNRDRLTAKHLTNLRYVTLSVIYVSSTAEIFVRGVAESPWQPMVLMVLSAVGVLAGMLLRVRAFLYLGSSFLLISIVAMIWHASANFGWTWLWYVTGIMVGLGIILLFALFEKKRSELLRLVEGLRSWEA